MPSLTTIYDLNSVREGLLEAYQTVYDFIAALSDEQLHFKPSAEKWSAAENLAHLILSSRGIASIIARPKEAFAPFGELDRPGYDLTSLHDRYIRDLQAGVIAPTRFQPGTLDVSDRVGLLASWQMIQQKFAERLMPWTEAELDKYCLVHPLLKRLSMREMLFFTIFHTYHHLEIIKKRLNNA